MGGCTAAISGSPFAAGDGRALTAVGAALRDRHVTGAAAYGIALPPEARHGYISQDRPIPRAQRSSRLAAATAGQGPGRSVGGRRRTPSTGDHGGQQLHCVSRASGRESGKRRTPAMGRFQAQKVGAAGGGHGRSITRAHQGPAGPALNLNPRGTRNPGRNLKPEPEPMRSSGVLRSCRIPGPASRLWSARDSVGEFLVGCLQNRDSPVRRSHV